MFQLRTAPTGLGQVQMATITSVRPFLATPRIVTTPVVVSPIPAPMPASSTWIWALLGLGLLGGGAYWLTHRKKAVAQ